MFGDGSGVYTRHGCLLAGYRRRIDEPSAVKVQTLGGLWELIRSVGHHDCRDTELVGLLGEDRHDDPTPRLVERRSRFIGQKDRWIVHESPGDPDPLALTPG